jgi:hypothetical protein
MINIQHDYHFNLFSLHVWPHHLSVKFSYESQANNMPHTNSHQDGEIPCMNPSPEGEDSAPFATADKTALCRLLWRAVAALSPKNATVSLHIFLFN